MNTATMSIERPLIPTEDRWPAWRRACLAYRKMRQAGASEQQAHEAAVGAVQAALPCYVVRTLPKTLTVCRARGAASSHWSPAKKEPSFPSFEDSAGVNLNLGSEHCNWLCFCSDRQGDVMRCAPVFQPVVRLFVAGFLLGYELPSQAIAERLGHFSGEPILQPTGDGRNMRLIEDFSYTDANGAMWTAPKGTVTDGASIPSVLWSVIGSPFTGKYLNAAIIHDHFCANHRRPWKQVHRLFHEGMLAGGVDGTMAKMMYAAVYAFGPRWREERRRAARGVIHEEQKRCNVVATCKSCQRHLGVSPFIAIIEVSACSPPAGETLFCLDHQPTIFE